MTKYIWQFRIFLDWTLPLAYIVLTVDLEGYTDDGENTPCQLAIIESEQDSSGQKQAYILVSAADLRQPPAITGIVMLHLPSLVLSNMADHLIYFDSITVQSLGLHRIYSYHVSSSLNNYIIC